MKSEMLHIRKLIFIILIAVLLVGLGVLPVLAQDPSYTLTVSAGDAQSAPRGTHFAASLQVIVTDAAGAAVPGVPVTFSAPASGASAYLTAPVSAYGTSLTVTTDALGVASVSAAANCAPGAYPLTAAIGEQSVTFSLTNSGTSSEYCLDSHWMADPLDPGQPAPDAAAPIDSSVPGYWWRDTSSQNALLQHSQDIGQDVVVTLYTSPTFNVYVYLNKGGVNVTLMTTDHYYAIVGCGGGTAEATHARNKLFPYIVGKTLKAVIFPDSHSEFIWGCKVWAKTTPGIVYYSHADFEDEMLQQFYFEDRLLSSNQSFLGMLLPWGADSFVGAGRFNEYRAAPPEPYQEPNLFVSVNTDIILEGNTITLVPAIGEQKDNLITWLPGAGVLIPGSALSWHLPDIGAIPQANSDKVINDLYQELDDMRDYNASILVPKVGPAVIGASEVLKFVMDKRDALQYIRDQTLIGINAGYNLDELEKTIKLPDALASSPYNQEFASDVPGLVRVVWSNFMGGWDGNVTSLASTVGETEKAQILAEAYGGVDALIAAAKQAELNASDLESAEKALYIADAAYRVAPDNFDAKQIYVQTLRKNAFLQKSAYKRNYYLTLANGQGGEQRVSDIHKTGQEDSAVSFSGQEFSQSFSDLSNSILTTVRIDSLPEYGGLTLAGASVSAEQEIPVANLDGLVFTPAANWNGQTSFNWNGSDGSGYAALGANVYIMLESVNDAPVVAVALADLSVDENGSFFFDLAGVFTDVDGDPLTYSAASDPLSLVSTALDETNLTIQCQDGQHGAAIITVTAADPYGLSGTDDFIITVNPVNSAPWAHAQDFLVTSGNTRSFTLEYGDLETATENLSFQIVTPPAHGALNGVAPALNYTAYTDYTGDDSFTYTVADRGDPDGCSAAPCSPALTSPETTVTIHAVQTGVAGRVFNDSDADGIQDQDETGLAGATIQLIPADGSPTIETTTGANGAYAFDSLLPGAYQVHQVLLPGYLSTTADPVQITLAEGQALNDINFGAVASADLQVSMNADVNGRNIIYTITVTNQGPADALDVILADPRPEGTAIVSLISTQGTCRRGRTIDCSFGTLASGSSVTVTIKVIRFGASEIINSATVSSNIFDIYLADNSVTVTVP